MDPAESLPLAREGIHSSREGDAAVPGIPPRNEEPLLCLILWTTGSISDQLYLYLTRKYLCFLYINLFFPE